MSFLWFLYLSSYDHILKAHDFIPISFLVRFFVHVVLKILGFLQVLCFWYIKVWEVWTKKTHIYLVLMFVLHAIASCFLGFFSSLEASSMLYYIFCIYHMNAIGHDNLFYYIILAIATLFLQCVTMSLNVTNVL